MYITRVWLFEIKVVHKVLRLTRVISELGNIRLPPWSQVILARVEFKDPTCHAD
jgi:hypothetical protein